MHFNYQNQEKSPKVCWSLEKGKCNEVEKHGLAKGWHFFRKGPDVSILGFVGHAISITPTQLCHCSVKADIDNMLMNEHNVFQ